jgi:peptide/nickel transport system substrate-binding protein
MPAVGGAPASQRAVNQREGEMRKYLLTAAALAVALPWTAAAGAAELRVGYSSDITTLDPANHRSRVTEGVIHNMYDAVVTRTDDMRVVPEIAESFEQIDATTFEAKIRPGIRFHDGSELTAEDVKFTFDRLTKEGAMDGQTSPRQSLVGPIADTVVVDPHTVRFKLSSPWPIFKAYLPFNQVVSKAFVEKVGTDGMATQAMGSGPYNTGS